MCSIAVHCFCTHGNLHCFPYIQTLHISFLLSVFFVNWPRFKGSTLYSTESCWYTSANLLNLQAELKKQSNFLRSFLNSNTFYIINSTALEMKNNLANKANHLLCIHVTHYLCLQKIGILVLPATSGVNPTTDPVLPMNPSIPAVIKNAKYL